MPLPSTADLIRAHLLGSADVMRRTAESTAEDLGRAAGLVADAFRSGGKLLLCGNGGSAADCSHLAAEFVNLLDRKRERPGLRELAWIEGDSGITPHSGLGSRSPHQYRTEQPPREAPIRSLEWT